MKNKSNLHFIISRTDNLGDVVLTLPMAGLIKQTFPNSKISFIARNYAHPILHHCQAVIDEIISWDELDKLPVKQAVATLKATQASHFIHCFPKAKIAKIAYQAKIPHRIGTSRRLPHWLKCNHRPSFSRANSLLHESQLNLKLLADLIPNTTRSLSELIRLNPLKIASDKQSVKSCLSEKKFNLVLHPLSNGSGREWPIEKFASLIQQLDPEKYQFIITGSTKESDILKKRLIPRCPNAQDLSGQLSLEELLHVINNSDGLVANSTGPLHIAAALGINTLGLFPLASCISASRWKPLGQKAHYLEAARECDKNCLKNNNCSCMLTISENDVKKIIENWQKM